MVQEHVSYEVYKPKKITFLDAIEWFWIDVVVQKKITFLDAFERFRICVILALMRADWWRLIGLYCGVDLRCGSGMLCVCGGTIFKSYNWDSACDFQ